jgi:DNA-directed RNA polymerase II subunit RPB1
MKRIQTNEYSNPSKIIGIQFSMLSPEEIRKTSVVEVVGRDTFGGLFDPKMGVLEHGFYCPTDGLSHIDSPGYFGHMEMAMPVFFIQHIKEIFKILKVVCYKCSKLLINKQKYKNISEMKPEDRWAFINGMKFISRCGDENEDGCGCKQPSMRNVGFASVEAVWDNIMTRVENDHIVKENVTQKMTPDKVYKILKRISNEDVHFIGFSPVWSRPEWMICQVLPIPPPTVRPSVKHDAQQRSEDDLTLIYMSILKYNNILKDKIASNASSIIIDKYHQVVQYYVAMIANNKASGTNPIGQVSGRTYQCISSRLNTKSGRIRGNLMGKRVDFSARSVITGDPNLSITQLGVPLKIAKNITKPVLVNERNKDFLTKLVENGPDQYPGAKILEKKNGENISLRHRDRNTIELNIGDTVHRHMMDGDYVLFNRQPSLHKMSMMCHEVQVMTKGDTFRFNVGVTNPYNADFDGDEMNMHMPQSTQAETELMYLPIVTKQIISPSKNSPIIGIFQDSLLGCYLFTRVKQTNMKILPKEAMNLLMMFRDVDTTKIDKNMTAFDVLSQIMPPLTIRKKNELYNDDIDEQSTSNNIVEIQNGKYIRGQIEKNTLAASTSGLLHRIVNDYSNETCVRFIDDLQNVVTEYMKTCSFSVGISDLIANKNTKQNVSAVLVDHKQQVNDLISTIHHGKNENDTAYSNLEYFEMQVSNILNKATEKASKVGRTNISETNRFKAIVDSGSKGSVTNILQMMSCLGQQSVEGKRVPYGFEHRTLPHFQKFDDSPTARGFIEHSYINGLDAHELFFHAIAGRIGLIDTAVKTSQTGYAQRKIVKALEDITVSYDMTVRNHMGKIVQFMYGEDGFDSTRVESQSLPIVNWSIEDIYMHYDIPGINDPEGNSGNELVSIFTHGALTRLNRQRSQTKMEAFNQIQEMIDNRAEIIEKVFHNRNDTIVKVPVAFQHIIANIQGQMQLSKSSMVDITPSEAFRLISENYKRIENFTKYTKPPKLFKILYDFYLSPKDLLYRRRFNKAAIVLLLETTLLKYKQAIVHPGEMVGVIAAQSVGEPTTQLTLNTFHNVGVASKSNVTRGVPRIEEILRLSKKPKNPSLTIYLKEFDEQHQDRAVKYATMIEHTRLNDIVKGLQILFDPNDANTMVTEDQPLLKRYKQFESFITSDDTVPKEEQNKSKWVIRMVMDPEKMLSKNITMDDVYFAITKIYREKVQCVYSDYNDSNLIFRIRLMKSISAKEKTNLANSTIDVSDEIHVLKSFQDDLLKKIILRGIDGILKVLPRKIQGTMIKNNTDNHVLSKSDGKFVPKDTWVLDTTGTNYLEVLGLQFIDYTKTYSNDIYEVFVVLGIEAARQVILQEITDVMEHSSVYINYHHLSLLCDRITYSKDMVQVQRNGLLKDNTGPLAKASFEMHTEMLLQAARFGHVDNMKGVSANVMTGQFGSFGTGAFQLVLNLQQMESNNTNADVVNHFNHQTEIENHINEGNTKRQVCDLENVQIGNPLKITTNIVNTSTEPMCKYDNDDYDMGF